MKTNILTGTWKLKSWEATMKEGSEVHPFGTAPEGLLMYDENGKMMVSVTKRDRNKFNSPNFFEAKEEEMISGFKSMLSYFCSYKMDEVNQKVTHHG